MKVIPDWQYDEFQHCGVDYDDQVIAETYDEQHGKFRGDMAQAAEALLDELGVVQGQTLIDVGCGTGFLAVQAARRCRTVYAVDVSATMLQMAQRKAEAAGVRNIVFSLGGFLTYDHASEPVDVITSTATLHHLPDVWKQIGLQRLFEMLKDGGLFYLMDSVYTFQPPDHAAYFNRKVAWYREHVNAAFGQEVIMAIRQEYSTYDWIIEGMLTRAGFNIERSRYSDMLAWYWCRKAIGVNG